LHILFDVTLKDLAATVRYAVRKKYVLLSREGEVGLTISGLGDKLEFYANSNPFP